MAFSLIMNGFALAVLAYRSRFLPRFLPQLACSLADHQRLLQSVNDLRFTIHGFFKVSNIAFPALLGEMAFMLWLVIRGVNVRKWEERAHG